MNTAAANVKRYHNVKKSSFESGLAKGLRQYRRQRHHGNQMTSVEGGVRGAFIK